MKLPFSAAVAAACLLGGLVLFVAKSCGAQAIPHEAGQYKRTLIREARMVWGLDAPVATLAAQIHQESRWNPNAKSKFASGLAQFTPATAEWIAQEFPNELSAGQPTNPDWALRAISRYDRYLWQRIEGHRTNCDRMAFALAGYNGGPGWINKDRRLAAQKGADAGIWFGSVEKYNAGRAAEFFKENRGYPERILHTLQPLYTTWGPGVPCVRA